MVLLEAQCSYPNSVADGFEFAVVRVVAPRFIRSIDALIHGQLSFDLNRKQLPDAFFAAFSFIHHGRVVSGRVQHD